MGMPLTLVGILAFSLLSSVGSVAAAGIYLLLPAQQRQHLNSALVGYATGALLGAAFLILLPEALTHAPALPVLGCTLAGMLTFFLLEKLVLWRHAHHDPDPSRRQGQTAAPLVLLGDTVHNFTDGVVIAAAFMGGWPAGVAASLAAIGHEIPQEVGDFAVLLECGYSRRQAILCNVVSGMGAPVGGLVAYFSFHAAQGWLPYVTAFCAASFIYIAAADLVPGLHGRAGWGEGVRQGVLVTAGMITMAWLGRH